MEEEGCIWTTTVNDGNAENTIGNYHDEGHEDRRWTVSGRQV